MKNFLLYILFYGVATTIASAQVSGTVFRDFNANGTKDNTSTYSEPGVPNITVKAYNSAGTQVGSTQTTSATGTYSFTGLTLPIRVEFSGLGTGDYTAPSGTSNGTSIQFVTAASTNVNFAVNASDDYWNNTAQSNPKYLIPCYVNGDKDSPFVTNEAAIVAVDESDNGLAPTLDKVAKWSEVGAVWGSAFQRTKDRYFFSAMLKRHAGVGPKGLGGIYMIENTGSGYGVTGSFSLEGVTPSNGGSPINVGSVTRVTTPETDDNYIRFSTTLGPARDLDAYAKVGKTSFGDIELDNKTNTLFIVNTTHAQRSIITVDVSGGTASLNNASAATLAPLTKSYLLTTLSGFPTSTKGVIRPWALKIHKGMGYLGVVDDASISKDPNDLRAYVLKFDPQNIAAGFSNILTIEVSRKYLIKAWEDSYAATGLPTTSTNAANQYNQPVFGNIEFDENDALIAMIFDRLGHQVAPENYPAISGNTALVNFSAYGDILHACYNYTTQTYEMEGATGCIGQNTAVYNTWNAYDYAHEWFDDISGDGGAENGMGGMAKLMGSNRLTAVVVDPFPGPMSNAGPTYYSTGGMHWYDVNTGQWNQHVRVYAGSNPYYAKAHGLGDIEPNLSIAPIEIGNRVWDDIDKDGVQDANETGIAGATVNLYAANGTTLVGTATTDANGNYFFSSATGTSTASKIYGLSLAYNTNYVLSFPTTISGKILTTKDLGANDLIDSDAATDGKITITTGFAAENNHTYDVGYICVAPTATATTALGTCTGSTLNNDASISITGATGDKASISTANAASFDGAAYATATSISAGSLTFGNLEHGKNYIIRLYSNADSCFSDITFSTNTKSCCPSPNCGTVSVIKQ